MFELDGRPTGVRGSVAAHALTHLGALAASRDAGGALGRALERIDDATGETWHHLYGLCADVPAIDEFVESLQTMDPVDFRRAVLGSTAWSWVNVAGGDVLEAAVHGDAGAAETLLSTPRYYAGSAAESLRTVLRWTPSETRQRFVHALELYVEDHRERLQRVGAELEARERAAHQLFDVRGGDDALVELTGYRYLAEPEADRVVVLIHAFDDSLCLAQHEGTRLIVHGRPVEPDTTRRILELGAAIGDEKRLRLLQEIARGPRQLGDLLDATDLTRSTVHHHLSILRRSGLVEVEGNARSYRYRLSADAESRWVAAWQLITHAGRNEQETVGTTKGT